jgi:hypothetical protein
MGTLPSQFSSTIRIICLNIIFRRCRRFTEGTLIYLVKLYFYLFEIKSCVLSP